MKFKTRNWDHVKSQGMNVRVEYPHADLVFRNSGKTFFNVPTTVVTIWNAECRYVGVAQCGPNDAFNRERGREIAAGRALKALDAHIDEPDLTPNHVLELDGEVIHVYGYIPESVQEELSDSNLFEHAEFAE